MEGNVFNNQTSTTPIVPAELESGQGDAGATENTTVATQPAQGTQPATAPATQAEIDYKAKYEEVQKSYDNLRPVYTKATQELSALKKAAEAGTVAPTTAAQIAQPTQPNTQAQPQQPVNAQEQFKSLLSDAVGAAIAPLTQKMKDQEREAEVTQQLSKFIMANPKEFEQVAPELYKTLSANPDYWALGTEKAINIAYQLAKGQVLEQALKEGSQAAVDAALANKAFKGTLPQEGSRAAQQQNTTSSPEDNIKSGIMNAGRQGGSLF